MNAKSVVEYSNRILMNNIEEQKQICIENGDDQSVINFYDNLIKIRKKKALRSERQQERLASM